MKRHEAWRSAYITRWFERRFALYGVSIVEWMTTSSSDDLRYAATLRGPIGYGRTQSDALEDLAKVLRSNAEKDGSK